MKQIVRQITENYKLVLVVVVIALLLGYIIGSATHKQTAVATDQHPGESTHQHIHESTDQIWTCSMHPQIKMDEPGKCPICGMDLIPLVKGGTTSEESNPNEVVMTESAAKLADIETLMVSKGIPQKTVYLQGKIQADERNIAELTARFGGRIENLFVNFTGQEVSKGEKLATVYSPGLLSAQRELLEAIAFKDTRPTLYNAARAKLKLWDLTEEQITAIEEEGEPQVYFDVLSPISGTVTARHVAVGDYIKEGNPLFRVVDLTSVWGMFDAYESDLPWIKLNDKIEFTVQALPGKNYTARVSYIDPFIDARTRIAKIRVQISNKGRKLKPEMFLNGVLTSERAAKGNEILVPKSSILWTGKRAVVYVKVPNRENPSFVYREVVLGPEAGAFYVITDGLMEGEEIAVNGVFKIDAAAQLQGLPSMMNPEGGAGSRPHDMSKMNMDGGTTKSGTGPKSNPDPKAKSNPEFKQQLGAVLDTYIKLKDALVDTDEAAVEAKAKAMLDALEKVDMGLLKGDAHINWMKTQKPLIENLNGIIQMKGIEMKRNHFMIVSDKLIEALKMFGVHSDKTVYLEFCPMANKNTGAFWVSLDKEIKNPYFGQKMLGCGEVKEIIK